MALHESGEMYLETIYILAQKSPSVRSVDVGEYMGFSKPSVSRAVGLLKKDGYITMDAKGYIALTEKGEREASRVYERHLVLTGQRKDRRRGRVPHRALHQRRDLCRHQGAYEEISEVSGRERKRTWMKKQGTARSCARALSAS